MIILYLTLTKYIHDLNDWFFRDALWNIINLTSNLGCKNETKVECVLILYETFGSNNLEDSYREPGEHYVPSLLISWLVKLHDLNKCSFHKNKKNNLSSTGFFPMERFKRRNIIEYIDICRGKIKNYPWRIQRIIWCRVSLVFPIVDSIDPFS